MIYFIQAGEDRGPIKIGLIDQPHLMERRLRALQTGNPAQLYLRVTLPGDEQRERTLHSRFAQGRIRGEWFEWDTPGLQALIDDAVEAQELLLAGAALRYCEWCRVKVVQPPFRRFCGDVCAQEKERLAERTRRALREIAA